MTNGNVFQGMNFLSSLSKKKEMYFYASTIDKVSSQIEQQLSCVYTSQPKFHFHLNETALFVLDMQNYFTEPRSHAYVPSSQAIMGNINKLVRWFACHNRPIYFSRHLDTANATLMKSWWNHSIQRDDDYSELCDALESSAGQVIEKTTYDFFTGTTLNEHLRQKKIESIVITGVMTHLCCDATARSAFVKNYKVFFPIDATATYNLQYHMATFFALSHGFVVPTLTSRLMHECE